MIDLADLSERIDAHGRVARIVVAAHKGSTPRESGADMLVWADGCAGSIGGGRLEHDAVARARLLLAGGPVSEVRRQALGPALAQCCGGSVTLVTEVWDQARCGETEATGAVQDGIFARRVEGKAPLPARLRRAVLATGGQTSRLADGWLAERVARARQDVFIHGAGHVGQALARTLADLPQYLVHVVDPRPDWLDRLPGRTQRSADPYETAIARAPASAAHYIMTPSHEADLAICHALLQRPFGYAGLIGSATKWARFRKRLAALGHSEAQIARIECPIGDPALGKRPQEIAIGVAAALLRRAATGAAQREDAA